MSLMILTKPPGIPERTTTKPEQRVSADRQRIKWEMAQHGFTSRKAFKKWIKRERAAGRNDTISRINQIKREDAK